MVTGRSASGGDSSFWAIEKAMPPRGLFIALFSPVRFSNSLGGPKLSTRLDPRSRAISKQFEKMMTMQLASQRHSAHPVQAMRYVDIFRTQCRTRGPSEWRFSDPASSRPPRLNSESRRRRSSLAPATTLAQTSIACLTGTNDARHQPTAGPEDNVVSTGRPLSCRAHLRARPSLKSAVPSARSPFPARRCTGWP